MKLPLDKIFAIHSKLIETTYKHYYKLKETDQIDKIATSSSDIDKLIPFSHTQMIEYVNDKLCKGLQESDEVNIFGIDSIENTEVIVPFFKNLPQGYVLFSVINGDEPFLDEEDMDMTFDVHQPHLFVNEICSSGKFLFFLLKLVAKDLGIRYIILSSINSAIDFYKSIGFEFIHPQVNMMVVDVELLKI
jgi:hypothetical protein